MPDLLAHALLGYVLGTSLSWRLSWLDARWTTVVILGAFVPDIVKIRLAVPNRVILALFGDVPFSWAALHTAGPVFLSLIIGVLAVGHGYRRRVFGLLALGAISHLLADALILNPSGRSYSILWPLTRYHPPTPGLYVSADLWPTALAMAVAVVVWRVDRRPSRSI